MSITKLLAAAIVNRQTEADLLANTQKGIKTAQEIYPGQVYLTAEEEAQVEAAGPSGSLPEFAQKILGLQGNNGPERG